MNIAIILAGGIGSRMKLNQPKQFLSIQEKPLIFYTLNSFQKASLIDKIIVVCMEKYTSFVYDIVHQNSISKFHSFAPNGDSRQDSVFNALSHIHSFAKKEDIIIIHDAVRAMISPETINLCVKETHKYHATTLASKSKNTLVLSQENGKIQEYLDRNFVYNIQTPQSFTFEIIYTSHVNAKKTLSTHFTDDSQIVKNNHYDVHIIENPNLNIKLTTPEDLLLFEYFIQKNQ